MKPVAVVIVDKDGVRVESVKGGGASLAEKIVDAAGQFAAAKKTGG